MLYEVITGEILYRLRPRRNDAVNDTWMCDVGRLEYRTANESRLLVPIVRENGTMAAASWESLLVSTANRLRKATEA